MYRRQSAGLTAPLPGLLPADDGLTASLFLALHSRRLDSARDPEQEHGE
jgi:hypothetical protein